MFAVIKTGGKQHRVAANDVIPIERRAGAPGDAVTFDEVLMLTGADGIQVGAPTIAGATVGAEIVEQARGPKVIAFKKRRRKNSRRKRGHRQELTVVRITRIGPEGAQAQPEAPVEASRDTAGLGSAAEPTSAEPAPNAPADTAAAPAT